MGLRDSLQCPRFHLCFRNICIFQKIPNILFYALLLTKYYLPIIDPTVEEYSDLALLTRSGQSVGITLSKYNINYRYEQVLLISSFSNAY